MKQLMKTVAIKIFLTVVTFFTCGIVLMAQDSGGGSSSSTTVTTTHASSTNWYAQPWVWIVGAAVFILLLVALVSGSRSSDVRVTKTTTTREV